MLGTPVIDHHVSLTNQDGVSTVHSGNLLSWAFTIGLMQVTFSWVPVFDPFKNILASIPTHSVNMCTRMHTHDITKAHIPWHIRNKFSFATHGESWKALIFGWNDPCAYMVMATGAYLCEPRMNQPLGP